ncbi:MAG: transposase [Alkaliphilus sp.]
MPGVRCAFCNAFTFTKGVKASDHTFVVKDSAFIIALTSRKGLKYANEKYSKLVEAAKLSKSFGHYIESGKFKGTKVSMSKRGSRLARRVLFIAALASVRGSKLVLLTILC